MKAMGSEKPVVDEDGPKIVYLTSTLFRGAAVSRDIEQLSDALHELAKYCMGLSIRVQMLERRKKNRGA